MLYKDNWRKPLETKGRKMTKGLRKKLRIFVIFSRLILDRSKVLPWQGFDTQLCWIAAHQEDRVNQFMRGYIPPNEEHEY
jgi:hypothetical protein